MAKGNILNPDLSNRFNFSNASAGMDNIEHFDPGKGYFVNYQITSISKILIFFRFGFEISTFWVLKVVVRELVYLDY